MNIKLIKTATVAFLCSTLAILNALDAEEIIELDDLEVVGKYLQSDQVNSLKTATPIEEIPQSVSILTSDLLSLQGTTSISEIADYVPGISAGQGEGHRDHIMFRGFRSTADFFVDGVRDDVQYYRPLYNIDQVEVLRGANALFFGRGGTGGLINRVTKTAQIGDKFSEYQISMDDFGGNSIRLDTNVTVNSNAAVRLNYYEENLENHRDFYYGDNSGFNPTFKFNLGDNTAVNLSYETLDHDRYIDRGIPSVGGTPVSSLADTTFGSQNDNLSTLDAENIRLTVDHKLNDSSKIRFNYTDNEYNKMYQNLYADSYDATADTVTLAGYRDTTDRSSEIMSLDFISEKEVGGFFHKFVFGYESIKTSNDNGRFYMDTDNEETLYTLADQASWLVNNEPDDGWDSPGELTTLEAQTKFQNEIIGTEVNQKGEKITIAVANPLDLSATPYNFVTEEYDGTEAELEVSSIYFSDEISVTDKLDVVLGGRLDTFDLSVTDVYGNSGGSASKKDEEFSPRLGFSYKASEDVTYYASYSESFIPKSGDQYADLKGTTKQKTDPDVYENTEFGVKYDLNSGISLTAAYYDLNAVKPSGSVQDGNYSVSESSVEGYEITLIGNINRNWFISAGADIIKGDAPEEVADKSYSLWNLFKIDSKLSLGLGLIHKGDTLGKGKSVNLPSYTRVDASAHYKVDENLSLQVNIENLTDKLYFPHSYGSGQVSVGAPLHATFKIVGKF